jgi:CHAT domain-containing protein
MKRVLQIYVLSCFLIVSPSAAFAQNKRVRIAPQQQPPGQLEAQIKASLKLINGEQYELAYQQAKRALVMSQRRGDKGRQARAANLLAIAALHLGRTNEAIGYFKQASGVADEARSEQVRKIELTGLDRAGQLLRVSGRYDDALFCFQRTLQLYHQQNNRQGEALMLSRLGAIYSDTGDFAKADQQLQEALTIARALADKDLEATVLVRLMVLENERGNPEAALKIGQQIVPLNLTRVPAGLEYFYQLGMVYSASGQYATAAGIFARALEKSREIGVPLYESLIQGEFAWTRLKLGNAEAAADLASQALYKLRRAGGNKHFEAKFLSTLAEAQATLGRNEEALASYRQAIGTLEQARQLSVPTEISRAGIVFTRQKVFTGAIEFLLGQRRTAESLEVAEAYHARAFLDVLNESRIDPAGNLTLEQKEREDKYFERIAGIQKELWQPNIAPEAEPQLKTKLATAENELEAFRLELRRANPHYASVESPQPIKSENIANDLLGSGTALIEFVLGDQKSFAWVVSQNKIFSVLLPPRKEIETALAEYRELLSEKVSSLTAAQAVTKLKAKGRAVSQRIFQPLEAYLSTASKLVIVSDGALSYLPFETLVTESKPASGQPASGQKASPSIFLIERFAISYAPSASALAALNVVRKEAPAEVKGIVAFGDPDYEAAEQAGGPIERGFDFRRLPYTRTEVNEIAALFPASQARIYLGPEASEEKVKAENLSRFRYVHLAAHGMIDEEYPVRSGIILSAARDSKEDGALQMSEVMRLKLNADLVTLSACRTGLGKLLNGEGIIGLTRSFLYAGADSVVVSLWNVNDIATASLMKTFYKHLQQGMPKDEALRRAKLELIKGQKQAWQHPYYWAPFVLIGAAG